MAMYENRGYCPNNAFLHYAMNPEKQVSELWKRTSEILGDRIGYMVYTENGCNFNECYVVDALVGASSTLGVEVAVALKQLIPVCKYSQKGRPIVCTDLINPYQIPAKIRQHEGGSGNLWHCSDSDTILFEDERYLVAIQDDGKEVHIYLYKFNS